jgi:glycosyltransferase involved in cell wall biosynthesis
MRLLFLSNFYPPSELGGLELRCQETVVRLRRRGHIVSILTSCYSAKPGLPSEADVSRQLYLESDVYHYRPLDFFFKRPGQERANERQLRQTIADFSPDLVVIWGMWNLSQNLAHWAEQWMPGRVAYVIASYWPQDVDAHRQYWALPARNPVVSQLKRLGRTLALRQLDREGYPPALRFEHAACCSYAMRQTLVSAGRLPASTKVFYPGIDPAPFLSARPAHTAAVGDTLRLIYFGGLLPQKGVHTAVEALGLLKQRGLLDKMQLTLLGGGHPDYEAQLHRLAQQLGVEAQVHFAGRVPRDEIPARLADYDVFLFTSVWAEPMARTVMEAMAAGLLVIGSEVGGQVEMLIHEQNALTFRAGDADRLAQHVARAWQEPELRQRLAQAGRQLVLERFTLDRMVSDMEAWFRDVIDKTSRGMDRG